MRRVGVSSTGIVAAALFVIQLLPAPAQADPVLIDFESVPATIPPFPGVGLTTLTLTSGGVTMTITRENNAAFDILDPMGGFPVSFGSRVLSPFRDAGAFLVNLSEPTFLFGLDFGDIGPDVDFVTLEAYTALDQIGLVASQTFPYPGLGFPAVETVAIGGPIPALSLRFFGGSANAPDSVYFDNLRLDTAQVPGPTLLALAGMGAATFAIRYRRRRSVPGA